VPTREKRINVVKLRLMRMGKKKQPTYRVVAADARSPRNGRFIEIVGTYQPRQEPSVVNIDNDKAVAWLEKGAQPTETVEKLLKISGAWEFTGGLLDPSLRRSPLQRLYNWAVQRVDNIQCVSEFSHRREPHRSRVSGACVPA